MATSMTAAVIWFSVKFAPQRLNPLCVSARNYPLVTSAQIFRLDPYLNRLQRIPIRVAKIHHCSARRVMVAFLHPHAGFTELGSECLNIVGLNPQNPAFS